MASIALSTLHTELHTNVFYLSPYHNLSTKDKVVFIIKTTKAAPYPGSSQKCGFKADKAIVSNQLLCEIRKIVEKTILYVHKSQYSTLPKGDVRLCIVEIDSKEITCENVQIKKISDTDYENLQSRHNELIEKHEKEENANKKCIIL